MKLGYEEKNGRLITGQNSDILTSRINFQSKKEVKGGSFLLIDGLASVAAIGRPSRAQTFGDFADGFLSAVLEAGSRRQRKHVIFDRHREDFIKSETRKRSTKPTRPIRRIIKDGSGPLLYSWPNVLALPDNKSDHHHHHHLYLFIYLFIYSFIHSFIYLFLHLNTESLS